MQNPNYNYKSEYGTGSGTPTIVQPGVQRTDHRSKSTPPTEFVRVTVPFDNNCEDKFSGFSDESIRRGFIRRVYAILAVQLLFTSGVVCLFIYQTDLQTFVLKNPMPMVITACLLFSVTYLALVCCKNLRRKVPINFILLIIFTMSLAFMTGVISSASETKIVLTSMVICTACCISVTLFSFQAKFDFVSAVGFLFLFCMCTIFFGISAIIFKDRIMIAVYSVLVVLVYMGILAIDTKLIIGGDEDIKIDPEEYIAGALMLYTDIFILFLYILEIFRLLRP